MIRPARTGDASDIARVDVDTWRCTYDGILSESLLSGLSYSRRRIHWQAMLDRREGLVLIAESDADGAVGFAAAGPERSGEHGADAEVYELYLLPSHQGNGVGRRLVQITAARLASIGYGSLIVWVLADNPARGFYEHIHGTEVATRRAQVGNDYHREVAYLWPEITTVGKRLPDEQKGQ